MATSSSSHVSHASAVETSQPHVFSTPIHSDNNTITTPSLLFTLPNLNFSETRVQCVNSLLCIHPKCIVLLPSCLDAFTLIASPTTRQVVALPIDHSIRRNVYISSQFGYDPVRDEFKVLRLLKYYDGSHEFKVFTLGCDTSWRVVPPERPFALIYHDLLSAYSDKGLCVKGALHWTCSTGLLVFDVGSTEQFSVMPNPSGYCFMKGIAWNLQHLDLVEIDGCLCLVGHSSSSYLKLWILREYQAQVWEQKSAVLPSGVVLPLCSVPTGEILLLPFFLNKHVRGVYYDMDTMSSRRVVVMEMPRVPLWGDQRLVDVDIFYSQESFRPIKCGDLDCVHSFFKKQYQGLYAFYFQY